MFGTASPLLEAALGTLRSACTLTAVVLPAPTRRPGVRGAAHALLRAHLQRSLRRRLRALHVPRLVCGRLTQTATAARLEALKPDILVVAAFPFLLEPTLLAIPRLGAINLHPSLLPRHRGPAPLFWTYFENDLETGVTVHWMDAGADTGAILAQEAMPVPRGHPVRELYPALASRGAALLVRAVAAVADASAPSIRQDESRATRAPRPVAGVDHVDAVRWDAERVWHILAGLGGVYRSLLHDQDGRALTHGPARGFTRSPHRRPPGTVERSAGRDWRVYCHDGFVDVAAPPSASARLRALSHAWRRS